ncbi:MAG TPA: hypothetical protein VKA44_04150, partial [Gemmatimonadota bacterium]|nr:hypothetical protein [Gemmatimonadota bacterium]
MPGGTPSRPRSARSSRGRAALAAAACVAAVGCAAFLRPFDHAPSGLSRWDDSLRRLAVTGRFDSALALTAPDAADAGDDLLRLEYEGLAAHYAGDLERSRLALEAAGHLAEDRYTRSLTRMVLAFVSSDRTRAYDPPLTDLLFLHYYGALDYLAGGHGDGAAVEARNLEKELALADRDLLDDPAVRSLAAVMHAFAGAVFEATGRAEKAAVSYRLARKDGADSALAPPAVAAPSAASPEGSTGPWGTVVVAVERGFVAHRVERSLTLPLWPDEVSTLEAGPALRARTSDDGAAAGGEEARSEADDVALRVARRGLGLEPPTRRGRRLRDEGG